MIVHATVKGGLLVVDEPTDLPEGTTVELVVVAEPLDEMNPDERAALMACIDRGMDEIVRGVPGIPAEQFLRELKAGG